MGSYSYNLHSSSKEITYYALFDIAYINTCEYNQLEIVKAKHELERRASKIKVNFNSGRPVNYKYKTICLISDVDVPGYGLILPLLDEIKLHFYSIDERSNVILQSILSGYKSPFYQHILAVSIHVHKEARYLFDNLINSIDKSFELNGINQEKLYTQTDLKIGKIINSTLHNEIKLIDDHTKNFLKKGRYFAALSYLKDILDRLTYGFIVDSEIDDSYGYNVKKTNQEVIIYSNHLCWEYAGIIDLDGEVISKIIENIFALFSITKSNISLIEIYKAVKKHGLLLKSDVLVEVIKAFIEQKSTDLIKAAIEQLRLIEPHHPIILEAEKTIRRLLVFEQINQSINANLNDINSMSGLDFERFLENQFSRMSFQVERTKGSGDYGADLIVETNSGTRAAVQAKRFKQKVNLKAVQEVVASLPHYGVDFGIVIATSGFFPSAIELAKTNGVELWDEDKLIRFLSNDISFSMLKE